MDKDRYIEMEKRLGRWMHGLRERKGLSQEALGVQLQKSQSEIAKLEGGGKRILVVDLVAWLAALGIPLEEVYAGLAIMYNELQGEI
jgi:transcriptional regulator with XRE-family HTH domain